MRCPDHHRRNAIQPCRHDRAPRRDTRPRSQPVLGGLDSSRFEGNLLLDVLYGAEIRYLVDDDANDSLAAAMNNWCMNCVRPDESLALPIGGSTGAGALGYAASRDGNSRKVDEAGQSRSSPRSARAAPWRD